ncbi:MAG TPA: ricin-type beta-trefoil lectin domain protein [Actinocrinis sp.]|uniref:ricin-type beta-trefoil lectin domain protein n=1 Tax=Actinocrinis sp. TaxID=1920516 RepID=UPI002D326B46|nr:ricin-type beta-trefoil lectin domain protein [Actinocrinis sp.]HZU55285.1 ricin-type beta-trefoil lectin domain protein [Actinocrinis sp.]
MSKERSSASTASRAAGLAKAIRLLIACALAVAAAVTVGQHRAQASTNQLRGVNWADQRDNFVNGVLYPSGLSSSDTYSSAATVANQVVGQMYSITGANTVRIPINEPTVSTFWGTYTGAVDAALSKGNVILAYWAYSGGKPASTSAFYSMWDTVVAKYAGNANAYFEVINEPYAYSATDLDNLYNTWLTRYPSVPRSRVILDGTGDAQNAAAVGNDSRLNNTLIGIHDYSFFVSPPYTTESQWANHLAGEIGGFASRTVVTEWGAPMSPGTKNGVYYNTINYDVPNTNYFDDYVRGESSEMRALGVGSVYWPGLRDGDWYSMTSKTGSGASITLSLVNSSGLDRLQYAWGIGNGGSGGGATYDQIRNAATGLCIDGTGSTTNGATVEQSTCDSANTNQQWTVVADGSYERIQNRATGLFLDGMGRTANGSAVGQWSDSNSTNQQWTVSADGGNVRFADRGTGLYVDGMGRTASGSDLGQYSSSSSANQQWQFVPAG